jgi:hypothetical protein
MNNQARIEHITIGSQPSYKPTEAQRDRAAARRRFNRLYIYTPILLMTAVALILVGLMVWSVFTPEGAEHAAFLSGLADIILILILLPQVVIWGAVVALPIAFWVKRYQERRKPPSADQVYVRQYGRFRILFWQIDHHLDNLHHLLTHRILPAIVNPIIASHKFGAALKTWLQAWYNTLVDIFVRPNNQ